MPGAAARCRSPRRRRGGSTPIPARYQCGSGTAASAHRLDRAPVGEEARGRLAHAERRRDERAQHRPDVDLRPARRRASARSPSIAPGRRPDLGLGHLEGDRKSQGRSAARRSGFGSTQLPGRIVLEGAGEHRARLLEPVGRQADDLHPATITRRPAATRRPPRAAGARPAQAALISRILNFSAPRGAATSTVSPFLRPMIALPTGDSFESLFSAGFASAEPTMWYSTVLLAGDVAQPHGRADRDAVLRDLLLGDHARREQPLLELGDPVLEHRLLVLGVVVLGVLGDVAELAGDANPLGDLAALLGLQVLDLLTELLVALRGEYDFLQSGLLSASGRARIAP